MAHDILSKLRTRNSKAEVSALGITDRVYQAILEDAKEEIKAKALAEARMGAQSELSTAQAKTAKAESEAAKASADLIRANAALTKAQAENESLSGKLEQNKQTAVDLNRQIAALKKTLKLEQGTLTSKDLDYRKQIDSLNAEIKKLNGDIHKLEVSNANLQGQVSAKPKPVKTRKVERPPIAFSIEDVKRGVDNRITGATIKPVRS